MTSTLDRPVKVTTFQGVSVRRKLTNNLATVLVTLSLVIAMVPLLWVLFSVITKGVAAITSPNWFTNSQAGMTAFQAGGGVYHAVIGTLLQGLVCAIISIPIGILVAVYLVEYGGGTRLGKLTTFMVDILTGVPSIVAALFIYALWVATLGFQRSGFAVSLALVLLMVPVIVRATEEMLRIVPMDLREASYALGVPKWTDRATFGLRPAGRGGPCCVAGRARHRRIRAPISPPRQSTPLDRQPESGNNQGGFR